MLRRSNAAGCFLMVGIAAGAQQASVPKWPRVRVNVSIMDQKDAPAVDVKADALEVTDGKQAIRDAVLSPVGDGPESVCLLVDMSGSSYYARNAISAELREMIQRIPGTDEVCLVDFGSSVYVDAPLTTDRNLVSQGVGYLKSSGGSALLDAVSATAKMMEKDAKNERRVVVLISDGGENASKINADALLRELHQPEAPVVYTLVNWGDTNPNTRADGTRLRKLTEGTGGVEFPVKAEGDAVQAADSLLQIMQGRYELEFSASDPAADGNERKLHVELTKDLRKQKMKVVGPDGYVAARQ